MLVAKINVKAILKEHLFAGSKNTYLDIAFHDNRDGEDIYGNLGFITQSVSKEARDRGEKGPIIGNWKEVGQKRQPAPIPPAEREHIQAKSNGYAPNQDSRTPDLNGADLPF